MEQIQHQVVPQAKKSDWWKRSLIDVGLVVIAVALVTLVIFFLNLHANVSTVLLVYLFIVLCLVHFRGFWTAVLAAFIACLSFDFFLVEPFHSFSIYRFEEVLDLFSFLLFAIMLGYVYSKLQKVRWRDHEANIRYKERLRVQAEEVSRHDHEVGIFYDIVQATRDEKDLKYQLSFITQAIEEAFFFCGVRSCVILVPDQNGKLSAQRLPAQANNLSALTSDEEGSIEWVMKQGKSVTLPNIPLISRAKGSYLRRVVGSSTAHKQIEQGYSYIFPLLSGQKVLGVLRLLVEDNAHPRLLTIKHVLEMEHSAPDVQSELFAKLKDYAVSLIKQALIERALMQEESLRQELTKRTEELQAAIISSVSHDLRTPLVAIKVAASNLLDEETPGIESADHHSAVETILDEADWLGRILTRMIDLSRIEQGALKLEKELYPIEEIILTTLESRHMRALLRGRPIKKCVPEELPAVEVDPILISQVLANLVENAIRYTPTESPIEITAQVNRGHMLISVADRGPGIPAADKDHIFEKFYRVERKMGESEGQIPSTQGTGLGLAVCRGFVAAHGGHIWVQNRDDGGAIFQFTLPLR